MERQTIAALLDLRALDRLNFAFRLHRRGQGRVALHGTLAAAVTQTLRRLARTGGERA